MNYLLVNGSPHRGNTWKLAEEIKADLARLSPDTVFEELNLADLNLPFCTGCSLCFRKGQEHCPHASVVRSILDKIEWSDGVIFAATTFNMQPPALTKNLIDHLCFMLHRPALFTKKALVISTTAGVGAGKTARYLAGTLRGIGFNRCYVFPAATYSWNVYTPDEKMKRRCAGAAEKFHADVASKKLHPPALLILIPYNLFRGMSRAYTAGSEYEYEDGAHWTDPVRAHRVYAPGVPVPFYKMLFGDLFYIIGKAASKSVTITYRK